MIAGRHRHRPASLPGYWLPVLLLGAVCLAACSEPPVITTLEPAEGHPHDVVLIKGTDLDGAEIVWDYGKTNKVIPGGYQGAYMFSVPHGATPDAYSVVVRKGGVDSNPMTFTIPEEDGPDNVARPPGPATREFPAPRIDAVTLVGATFEAAGVHATLYVQGANLDVGAIVSITDDMATPPVPVATTSHRVLRNEWFGVKDDEFDYPIYHYSSAVAIPGLRPAGQRIWLIVTNLDGFHSEPFPYELPKNVNTIDSDGDSLPDKWETGGYDAEGDGVVDVNLPMLGADPYRRDVFLELDIMDNVQHRPDRDDKGNPDLTVFNELRKMFEAAPIINLGEPRGINLVIDLSTTDKPCLTNTKGEQVCSFTTTIFDIGGQLPKGEEEDPFATDTILFSRLKEHGFNDAKRGKVFHYAVWAIQEYNGLTGFSDGIDGPGDDLVIALDDAGSPYENTRTQIETLAHELGHNLGQRHGGETDIPELKPNYLSVMSKSWLQRIARSNATRLDRATCLPFYYADPSAMEMSGSVHSNVSTIVDYSEGMARKLTRPMPSAAGSASFCGLTINWTTVGSSNSVKDFANWRALAFDGPAKNGTLQP